jgi:flagellin-specific chaperone FliS
MKKQAAAALTYQHAEAKGQIQGQDPRELVVLLYDKAASSLKSACLILEAGALSTTDWEQRIKATELYHKHTSKVLEILVALRELLDFENGEPVASQLDTTYQTITSCFYSASKTRNHGEMNKLLEAIDLLRDAWKEAIKTSS